VPHISDKVRKTQLAESRRTLDKVGEASQRNASTSLFHDTYVDGVEYRNGVVSASKVRDGHTDPLTSPGLLFVRECFIWIKP